MECEENTSDKEWTQDGDGKMENVSGNGINDFFTVARRSDVLDVTNLSECKASGAWAKWLRVFRAKC